MAGCEIAAAAAESKSNCLTHGIDLLLFVGCSVGSHLYNLYDFLQNNYT